MNPRGFGPQNRALTALGVVKVNLRLGRGISDRKAARPLTPEAGVRAAGGGLSSRQALEPAYADHAVVPSHPTPSWPGLSRPSTCFDASSPAASSRQPVDPSLTLRRVGGRDKPGHDGLRQFVLCENQKSVLWCPDWNSPSRAGAFAV